MVGESYFTTRSVFGGRSVLGGVGTSVNCKPCVPLYSEWRLLLLSIQYYSIQINNSFRSKLFPQKSYHIKKYTLEGLKNAISQINRTIELYNTSSIHKLARLSVVLHQQCSYKGNRNRWSRIIYLSSQDWIRGYLSYPALTHSTCSQPDCKIAISQYMPDTLSIS